ncbi:MAG TPA: hypothetical protein VGD08_16210 [Stellaceae bacterium]
MRKNWIRRVLPAAPAALLILLFLAGPLAACAVTVTPLPPHMNQRGAV